VKAGTEFGGIGTFMFWNLGAGRYILMMTAKYVTVIVINNGNYFCDSPSFVLSLFVSRLVSLFLSAYLI
jgi:hypothetical protein